MNCTTNIGAYGCKMSVLPFFPFLFAAPFFFFFQMLFLKSFHPCFDSLPFSAVGNHILFMILPQSLQRPSMSSFILQISCLDCSRTDKWPASLAIPRFPQNGFVILSPLNSLTPLEYPTFLYFARPCGPCWAELRSVPPVDWTALLLKFTVSVPPPLNGHTLLDVIPKL